MIDFNRQLFSQASDQLPSNQFSNGNMNDPNANTSWMNGGFQPNQQQAPQQSAQPGPNTPSNINQGTAIDAMNSGSYSPIPQYAGSAPQSSGIMYGNERDPAYNNSPWTGGFSGMGGPIPQYAGSFPSNDGSKYGGGNQGFRAEPVPINDNPFQQNNQQPAGHTGQYMPEGYDQAKFNDPANANSTKYQVGRIVSKYPPGQAGLQQAAPELQALGITLIDGGKSGKVLLPDGTITDLGKSFSDPNAQHAWQYNWSGPGGQEQGSMIGQQPANRFMGPMMPQLTQGAQQAGQQLQQPGFNWQNQQQMPQFDISSFLGNGPQRQMM